jgi:hypothetical protein
MFAFVVVAGWEVRGYIYIYIGIGECDGWWVPQGNGGDGELGFLCSGLRLDGNVLGAMHTRQSIN